jgi:dihydroneopterin aldolase
MLIRPETESLAYAELYLTIAKIVQQFDMKLVDTTSADVGIHHVRLTGYPKSSKGEVKVKITQRIVE